VTRQPNGAVGPARNRHDAADKNEFTTHLSEARIRDLVKNEVRRLLMRIVDDGPSAYTTRRGDAPPGWADERWHAVARTIPGAHKPGRWWVVPRTAYDRWVAGQSETQPATANDAPPAKWDPLASLEAARARRARGPR
jgi:hypothetical protein